MRNLLCENLVESDGIIGTYTWILNYDMIVVMCKTAVFHENNINAKFVIMDALNNSPIAHGAYSVIE